MLLKLGPLQVKIKYTYTRGNTTFYQRAVPIDLQDRYAGKTIKQDLKTADPIKVARLVSALNKRYEAEWEALRGSPELSTTALQVHADKFLQEWGLEPFSPDNDPMALELLHDHIDRKRERWSDKQEKPERAYAKGDAANYMSLVELEAFRRLYGEKVPVLSDTLNLYLETHRKRNDEKFVTFQKRAFTSLIDCTGDKPVASLSRADVHAYIDKALKEGQSTGTVRRRLNIMGAVFNTWIHENSLTMPNPFTRISIPDEGKDKKKRVPFTLDELATIYSSCKQRDDELRWLVALMIDTGPRIAEVAGLVLSDLVIDHPVPHMVIQEHPWRSLKNQESKRKVPLVGASLWAAKRIIDTARAGQKFAFPRYVSDTECKATSASNAANKFIRSSGMNHTTHEFRHTLADRLRNVGCPKDVRYSIDGHAAQDRGDPYGEGHSLEVKRQWLDTVALV